VVIDALQYADGREEHRLTHAESGDEEGECGSDGIYEEGFEQGIVEGTKGVRDVNAVVQGMNIS
jgi:hypothetical protein